MPLTKLIAAIRHHDEAHLKELLADPETDVNEMCFVEPVIPRRHELPVYRTHALFEAQRQSNRALVSMLLTRPDIDVNATATSLDITAFGDAVMRGDAEMTELLIDDPRVDTTKGCKIVSHPAILAAMNGNTAVIEVFVKYGLIDENLRLKLRQAATLNRRGDTLAYVETSGVDVISFDSLSPEQQMIKIRREFAKIDDDGNGFVDSSELDLLLVALGYQLTAEELDEAFRVLDTAGDNRIDLDELSAFLMGEEKYKFAVRELAATGGYGGILTPAAMRLANSTKSNHS